MTNPGGELRQARERAHLSLHDIAARTKIRLPILEAIEREEFEHLPAGVVTRGYLRAYAHEVGLDPEAVVRAYRDTWDTPPVEPAPAPPAPLGAPSSLSVVAVLVAASAIFVVYLNRSSGTNDGRAIDANPATDEFRSRTSSGEFESAADVRASSGVGTADLDAAATAGTLLRLEIHPSAPVWVDATADGERALYEIVPAGERRSVDAEAAISLRVGDAGRFSYSINGTPGRALGAPGQVRDVRITRDNYAGFIEQ